MVAAAACYAGANVMEERLLRTHTKVEVLAALGLFGVAISAVQVAALEGAALLAAPWTWGAAALLAGFTALLLLFYAGVPMLIEESSAVLFNLSMLSADVYSMLLGVLLLGYRFRGLYFAGFAAVLLGLALYATAPRGARGSSG